MRYVCVTFVRRVVRPEGLDHAHKNGGQIQFLKKPFSLPLCIPMNRLATDFVLRSNEGRLPSAQRSEPYH